VTVPTVERGLRDVVFWSIEMAGESPSIVAALPLRVDRVEGEARFAGAREPGDHDQRIARQPQVKVLEVVLAGA
jgi:hypothetical protein